MSISVLSLNIVSNALNGYLNVGDVVSVTVTMDGATIVTGSPTIALDIGGTTKQATYVYGSNSTSLVFTYTIEAGLTDADGISISAGSIALNSGTMKDAGGADATIAHGGLAADADYKVDTTAPAAPTVNSVSSTSDNTPTLTGTAEAHSTVTLYVDDVSVGTTTADGAGDWSITSTLLADGVRAITAKSTDAAGNVSGSSASFNMIVDDPSANAAPVMEDASVTLTSIDEDSVSSAGNRVSTFLGASVSDTDASAVEGIAIIALTAGNGTWQYSIDGSSWSNVGTVSASQALLLAADDLVRFVPDTQTGTTATFTYVAWDQSSGSAGTKADASVTGNDTAFSAESNVATIVVTDINDVPVIFYPSSIYASQLTEGNLGEEVPVFAGYEIGGVSQQPDSALSDAGFGTVEPDQLITSLAFTITNVTDAGEALSVFSGAAPENWISLASSQASASYTFIETNFINGDTDFNFLFDVVVAYDDSSNVSVVTLDNFRGGDVDSVSYLSTLVQNPINYNTLLAQMTRTNLAYRNTGDDVTHAQRAISLTLTDSGSDNNQATYSVATIDVNNSNDAPTTTAVTLSAVVEDTASVIITAAQLLANASDFEGDTLSVSNLQISSGDGSLASVNGTTWAYTPEENDDSSVSFIYTISDDGTSNGLADPKTVQGSATLDLTPVNDAPVMSDATPSLTPISEDDTSSAGNTVTNILSNSVSDVDASAVEGIAITALDAGNGTWQYSTDGSSWSNVGTVSITQALLLAADDFVRFIPNQQTGTTATFTYVAWDQTSGSVGTKVNASVPGGATAFSAESNTASITVSDEDDDFTDGNESQAINEDASAAGNVIDQNSSSVDGTITVASFTIAGDATSYSAGDTASITNIGSLTIAANGDYTFTPVQNYSGSVPVVSYILSDGFGATETSDLSLAVANIGPAVSSIGISATNALNGYLNVGDVVSVTVTMDEATIITGLPTIALDIGGTTKQATYVSGSNSTSLVFTYTIEAGLTDADGISISAGSIALNSGTMKDAGGADATIAYDGLAADADYKVDTTAPTVAITISDTSLIAGETATVTFTFSETPIGFAEGDITAANGDITSLQVDGSNPNVYTATFTPTSDITNASNNISVSTAYSDAAGNTGVGNESDNFTIDTGAPSVSSVAITSASGAANGYLNAGDVVSVTVEMDEATFVTGTPTIELNIGGIPKNASYLSGSGSTALVFTYTIEAGLTDADGISIGQDKIALNSGTLRDAAGNDATLVHSSVAANSSYGVDTTAPTVTITMSDTALKIGDTSLVTFTFSETPIGFAEGDITAANGDITSLQVDGSNPNVYTATFTPTSDITNASNNISVSTAYSDAAGNTGVGNESDNFTIDTGAPSVSSVAITSASGAANGYLNAGDVVSVTVEMDEATFVTGTPTIELNIGGIPKNASYLSGSGSTALVFTYTIEAGLTDADGISIGQDKIALNSGTLRDAAGNDATLVHSSVAANSSYGVDTTAPTVTITMSDTALKIGDTSLVTFTFSETPIGFAEGDITAANGDITSLQVDGSNPNVYTATFTPTSDITNASNNISVSTAYSDAAGNTGVGNESDNFTIDTTAPTVTITMSDTALKIGDTSLVTFTFSETPIGFAEGDITAANGDITSLQVDGSNPNVYTATFTPTSDITNASNNISVSTAYSDAAGNTGVGNESDNFTIDTGAPSVSSVAITSASGAANGYLNAGDVVSVTVEMDEATFVTGTPTIELNIGGIPKNASYLSGSGSTALVFTYTIEAGLTDADGISIGQDKIALNSGTLRDAAGNDATLVHSSVAANSSYGVDTTAPTVTITMSDTALKIGDTSLVTFTFSETPIGFAEGDITAANGDITSLQVDGSNPNVYTATFTPTSDITNASNNISVSTAYSDAAGNTGVGNESDNFTIDTTAPTVTITMSDTALKIGDTSLVTFTFSETPIGFAEGDITAANGDITSLQVDGSNPNVYTATFTPTSDITNASNNISVSTAYSDAAGNTGVGNESDNFTIDTGAPSVSSVAITSASGAANGYLNAGDVVSVTVEMDEATFVTGTPTIELNIGGIPKNASYLSGSGSTALVFTYTIEAGLTDADGISIGQDKIALNSGTLRDAAGNDATLVHSSVAANSSYGVDTTAPSVSSVAITETDGLRSNLTVGDAVTVTVTMDEATIVTGLPTIELNIGGVAKNATYESGSGTTSLLFTYVLESNLSDADGISITQNSLALNGGSLADAGGNDANLAHSAVAANASYLVNTLADIIATPVGHPGKTQGETRNEGAFAAILEDGSVVAWGDVNTGGDISGVSGLTDVVAIYSTARAFAALTSSGAVVTWGNGLFGGDSSAETGNLAGGNLSSGVAQVYSSGSHFVALKTDGSLVTWGYDLGGLYSVPSNLTNVVSVSSNSTSFAAILDSGAVVTWGVAFTGGDSSDVSDQLDGTDDVTEIIATDSAFAAIKADGTLVTWGSDGGDSSSVASALSDHEVMAVYATKRAFAAVLEDNTVVSWGASGYGANSSAVDFDGAADDQTISAIYSTDSAFAALLSDGSVVTWGGSSEGGSAPSGLADVQNIVATASAFAALKSDGSVVAWGDAGGTIGDASVSGNVVSLYANDGAFAALKSDGSVVTWGSAAYGGSISDAALAAELDGSAGQEIVSISTSDSAFVALRADGSLVTWGSNVTDGVVESGGHAVTNAVAVADITDKEAVASLTISSATGTVEEGALLTANLGIVTDADGSTTSTYQWQTSSDNVSWVNEPGQTGTTYQIASNETQVGSYVRVVVATVDALGGTSTITSAGSLILNVNDAPVSAANIANTDAIEAGAGQASVTASGPADALFAYITDSDNVLNDFVISRAARDVGSLASVNAGTNSSNGLVVSGTYGTLTIGADGSYSYVINDGNASVQAMDNGDSLNDSFAFEVSDGAGGTTEETLTFTLNGSNDGPVLSIAALDYGYTEAGDDSAVDIATSGTITFTDVDDIASISAGTASIVISSGVTLSNALQTALQNAISVVDNLDNTADWTLSLQDADLDFLDVGKTITLSVVVTATDDQGETATDTITLTITGTDDSPTISSSINRNLVEAGVDVLGGAIGTPTSTATVTVGDLDANSDEFFQLSQEKGWANINASEYFTQTLTYGSVRAEGFQNDIVYTLDDINEVVQALPAGETLTDSVVVEVVSNGVTVEHTIVFTITGSNDVPIVAAETASLDENATATGNVLTNASDDDTGASLVASGYAVGDTSIMTKEPGATLVGTFGSLTIASGGVYSYTADQADADALAFGESATDIFSYAVSDENGGTSYNTLTFTVNGTNDNPTVALSGNTPFGSVTEALDASSQTVSASGAVYFEDLDVSDNLTITKGTIVVAQTGGVVLSTALTVALQEAVSVSEGEQDGQANWSINATGLNLDFLDSGQTITVTIPITATDPNEATVTTNAVVTIIGTNDAPVLSVAASDKSATEDSDASAQDIAENGTITFIDLDDVASIALSTASVTLSSGVTLPDGMQNTLTNGFSVTNNNDNTASWSISLSDLDLDFLDADETITVNFVVTATDDQSETASDTVSLVITGSNDTPTITSNVSRNLIEVGDNVAGVSTATATLTIGDLDQGDTASIDFEYLENNGWVLLQADSYYEKTLSHGSVRIDAGSTLITYTLDSEDNAVDELQSGQTLTETVRVAVISNGEPAYHDVTFTINGTNDTPVTTGSIYLSSAEAGVDNEGSAVAASNPSGQTNALFVNISDVDDNSFIVAQAKLYNGSYSVVEAGSTSVSNGLAIAGSYGTLTVGSDGSYVYNINEAVTNSWDENDYEAETFVVQVSDGSGAAVEQTILVYVYGTNDAPVAGVAITNSDAIEAGVAANGSSVETVNASGGVNALFAGVTDVDDNSFIVAQAKLSGVENSYSAVQAGSTSVSNGLAIAGSYGTLTVGADGSYVYVVTNDNEFIQALDESETITDTFTIQVSDGAGGTAEKTLEIEIQGTNDVPISSGEITNVNAVEAGVAINGSAVATVNATGSANALFANVSDVDDNAFVVAQAKYYSGTYASVTADTTSATGTAVTGSYGTLTVGADGSYVYVVTNDNEVIQALDESETITDTFTIQVSDGAGGRVEQTLAVTVDGTNDAPVAGVAITNSDAIEAGVAANGSSVETVNASGGVNALFAGVTDVDDNSFIVAQAKLSGVENSYSAVQAGSTSVSNGLAIAGSYGTLTVGADGSYVYVVTNDNEFIQALDESETITDTFTIQVSDGAGGTAEKTLEIEIQGTNDAPVAGVAITNSDAIEAGVAANGSSVETVNASGGVNALFAGVTDVDDNSFIVAQAKLSGVENSYSAVQAGSTSVSNGLAIAGSYGTLTVGADGSYVYVVTNDNEFIQALDESETITDTFTIQVSDGAGGTAEKTLEIEIQGTNDAPVAGVAITNSDAIEAGVAANGSSVETVNASGGVNALFAGVTDVDDNSFIVAQAKLSGVENSYSAVQAGSTSVSNGLAIAGSYGTLTVGADGSYVYVVTNDNEFIQALDESETITDTFTIQVSDGAGGTAEKTLEIEIQGTNDVPISSGEITNVNAVEAGVAINGSAVATVNATGSANALFANVSDVDDNAFVVAQAKYYSGTYASVTADTTSATGTAVTGSYGTLTVGADGSYVYVVTNDNEVIQALDESETITDTFTIQVSDGAGGRVEQTLAVTVDGTNDAPVAGVAITNSDAIEAGVAANGSSVETVNASGGVNALFAGVTDVDDNSFIVAQAKLSGVENSYSAVQAGSTSVSNGLAIAGSYGTLTVGADGSYVYVVTNDNEFIQALDESETITDTFTIQVSDGAGGTAEKTLEIEIQGTNDAPVAGVAITNSDAVEAGENDNGVVTGSNANGVADALFANIVDFDDEIVDFTVTRIKDEGGSYQYADELEVEYANDYSNWKSSPQSDDHYGLLNSNGQLGARSANVMGGKVYIAETNSADAISGYTYLGNFGSKHYFQSSFSGTWAQAKSNAENNGLMLAAFETQAEYAAVAAMTNVISWIGLYRADVNSSFMWLQSGNVDAGTTSADGRAKTGSYGTLTVGADGSYNYDVDDTNATVQAMRSSDTPLTDSFIIEVSDGSGGTVEQTLDIKIQGTNDAPVAVLDTASLTEKSSASGNVLTNDTDVDTDSTLVVSGFAQGDTSVISDTPGTTVVGTYGSLILNGDGTYTYEADQAAADALAVGVQVQDVFSYKVLDEHNTSDIATLTFTVTGTNDAPTIGLAGAQNVDNSATFSEVAGADNGTSAVSFATGALSLIDVDSPTLRTISLSLSSTSLESGDQLVLGSTVIDLNDTSDAGEVVYGSGNSVFSYEVSTVDTNRVVTFTSLTAAGGSNAPAAIGDYSSLLSALSFSSGSDNFVDGTSRVFSLSVTDDQSLASQAATFTVTMEATNDALSGTPTIDGTFAEGNTLVVNLSALTDADGRNESGFTYQWLRSTDGGNTWNNIADATNSYYSLTRDDGLAKVKVEVTHTDLGGTIETVVSAASSTVAFSTVEGVFYDWYSHKVIHGVGISQSGDNSTSDVNGSFAIDKTSNDGYSFTLGLNETGSGVDILDALLAFNIAFGQPVDGHQVTAYQYYAADIDEDGDVDLSDAMSVFEMALAQPNAATSEWHFIDEQVDFWNELTDSWTVSRDSIDWSLANKMNDGDSGTANFVAIQKGDVNGSWSSDSAYDDANSTISQAQLSNLINALLPNEGSGDDWWII